MSQSVERSAEKTVKAWDKLICFLFGHLWTEWSHSDMPRRYFFEGSALLRNPYCNRCLENKFHTSTEVDYYEYTLRRDGMLPTKNKKA